jgi:uncharacterized membrane protein
MVQQAIEVSAPLHTVYEQLAAFENYPRFMSGVREVTAIGADQTHWIMDVDGKRREFDAQITERSLDERVSWSTMEGRCSPRRSRCARWARPRRRSWRSSRRTSRFSCRATGTARPR